jgi:rSAM/selenodomain-associated transferase 1
MRSAIIVMVKAPREGEVKTRLTPAISARQAALLAACFVKDSVNLAIRVVPDVIVAYMPEDGRAELQMMLPEGLSWIAQKGKDLGERMQAAVEHAAGLGFEPVLVIGMDSPSLPDKKIETAFELLTTGKADVVLGPAIDGGYYLVGMAKPVHGLFDRVDWGTSAACEQTVSNGNRLGLKVALLTEWYDVDTVEDLRLLYIELSRITGSRERAAATWRWMEENGDQMLDVIGL